jgi:endo-1,4-beta-xylanase
MLSRRQTLTMIASGAGALVASPLTDAHAAASDRSPDRIPYGACVRIEPLQTEPDYSASFQTYCQQLTAEGDLFWATLRPTRDQFRFERADAVLAFADANGMIMRGHTLVWYGAMPDWTNDIEGAADAEREMTTHIERVMAHYRGKVRTWHVVNEPIDDPKGGAPGLRGNVWLRNLGDKYIDLAFRTAHAVDPAAELVINEYDIECADGTSPKKREVFLNLIRDLLARGVPLHGVGLQGHIKGGYPIDRDGLYGFVAEVHSLGLKVHVTELDVIDHDLPAQIGKRDTAVAAHAHDFLEAISAAVRPSFIGTWGITDRYSWVPIWYKRGDGLPNRPLPLDEQYQQKPLWTVIDYFCGKTA